MKKPDPKTDPVLKFTDPLKQTLDKKTLIVFLSGLNGTPSIFDEHILEIIQEDLNDIDIFVPNVLKRGFASLDDILPSILHEIQTWAKIPGDKKLVLVGISNGARIARGLDAALGTNNGWANIKKLQFISIVGACRGSYAVNVINKLKLSFILNSSLKKEMPVGCQRMIKLEKDWLEGLSQSPQVRREYIFIATPHDWLVPNFDSTLLRVPLENAQYAIVGNNGHFSIIIRSAKMIRKIIFQ